MGNLAVCRMPMSQAKNIVYTFVGQKVRERRKILKMSQSQLSELMGFSYQQMQKYESGASQISVARLLQFSRVLNVPVVYFFDGVKLDDEIGVGVKSDIIPNTRTLPLSVLLIEEFSVDILAFKAALQGKNDMVDIHVLHSTDMVMDYLHHHRNKYGKNRPDLILLEIALDKNYGISCIKAIKRMQAFADIPIVVLTNSIRRKDVQDAFNAGASGFVQKQADEQGYRKSIENVIHYWSQVTVLPNM